MNVNKIVVNEIPSEIEFSGAVLLSANEASTLLTEQEREYKFNWWLRTPGFSSSYACNVFSGGGVNDYGYDVGLVSGIRPALIISNMGEFKVGDIFSIGDCYFKIISPTRAWLYKQDIGLHSFDVTTTTYEFSLVRNSVKAWYEKLLKDIGE